MPILDHRGNPVRSSDLRREVASPRIGSIRNVWQQSVANSLTPTRLAMMIQGADMGNARDYLMLAQEMEERELHYASVLGTRKMAVNAYEPSVHTAANVEDAAEIERAEFLDGLAKADPFRDLLFDALDGIGKGYSAVEIIWETSERQWWPSSYAWREPQYFVFDRDDLRTPRLLTDDAPSEGIDLPAYKFVFHMPKRKSGLPLRGGMARLVAVMFMLKSYSLKDWAAYNEVFGMPLRIGTYHAGATDDDQEKLLAAIAALGTDAAAILPEGMTIELKDGTQARAGANALPYLSLSEYADKLISKGVIGQTMTADDGASLSQAQVHNQVRGDIANHDRAQLEAAINRDWVKPIYRFNFGEPPDGVFPRFSLKPPKLRDPKTLTESLLPWVEKLDLRVEQSLIRDVFDLPEPDEGAELLAPRRQSTPPAPAAAPPPGVEPPGGGANDDPANNSRLQMHQRERDAIDDLVDEAIERWQDIADPIVDPIMQAARSSATFDQFEANIRDVLDRTDLQPMTRILGAQLLKSRGLGMNEADQLRAENAELRRQLAALASKG